MQMRSSAMDIVAGTGRGQVDPWSSATSSGSYWPSTGYSSSQGSSTSSRGLFNDPDPVFGLNGVHQATARNASPEGSFLMGNVGTPSSRNPFATGHSVPSSYGARSRLIQPNTVQEGSHDPNDPPKRLHVSNIPFRWRENELGRLFEEYGEVQEREIIFNDRGSKGFGFVTMKRGSAAVRAKHDLHHKVVEGRQIEVNDATAKPSPAQNHVKMIREANALASRLRDLGFTRLVDYGSANESFSSDRSTPTSTPQPGPVPDWRVFCNPPYRPQASPSGASGTHRGRATSESLSFELDSDVDQGPYVNPYAAYAMKGRRRSADGAVFGDGGSSATITWSSPGSSSALNMSNMASSRTTASSSASDAAAWPTMSHWEGVENDVRTAANRTEGYPFSSYSGLGITRDAQDSVDSGWEIAHSSGDLNLGATQDVGLFGIISDTPKEEPVAHYHGKFLCRGRACAELL
ncbi:hypothetical protein RvY_00554 [Ramazzottius varieornatus]|uniref:RRM domain-containing protein n=1 Tax=Ramazzottius varieornatus TaxID=947166 RepID=A0A1D1UJG6_RAMVA|nr:hypothetical protein RvY_00554 [Ramazzottius varieornatus]